MQLRNEKFAAVVRAVLIGGILAMLAAVAVYAHLGTFSRYLADDYCEAFRVTTVSPIQAVMDRYTIGAFRAANRYSNILFVGFSEMLGPHSVPITIAGMALLWALALSWLLHEARKLTGVTWHLFMDIFLGLMLAFSSFLQAPALFQTIYWRSSMMTHFAPLVFGSLLFAFLLRQARLSSVRPPSIFVYIFTLPTSFLLAGFSEPPAATLVTALSLSVLAVWLWDRSPAKKYHLALVITAFVGVFMGFLTLLFSPAVNAVARAKPPNPALILFDSFLYGLYFIRDSFQSLPLPLFLSFFTPFLLIWIWRGTNESNIEQNRRLPLWMALLPLLAWLLIAAGFAPSVFGQGFPVERMRFLARTWMIVTLMLEGIWLGLWLPDFKFNRTIGVWLALVLFTAFAIAYPLRTAINLAQKSIPEYRERAMLWDLRNEFILRHKAQGETDLVIPGFPGIYGVKELDDNPLHWTNDCAADFYDVSSIRTIPADDPLEALSQ